MFFFEYYSGVSNSVLYVLLVLVILWYSWNTRYVSLTGIIATLFIVAGFLVIENGTVPSVVVNRIMAIVTVWLSVIFVNGYRRLFDNEEVQKRQLQALFENATEGMVFTNSQGEIVRINPAAEKIFGYQTGELLGKSVESLVPDHFVKKHVGFRQNLFRNPLTRPKGSGRDVMGKCKDGTEFTAEISLSYFVDRQEVFYIAFVIDISDRKKQEAIIQANVNSIKRLNEALDAKVKQRTSELEAALSKLELANSKLICEIAERKKIEERLIKSKQLYTAIATNFPEGVIGVLDKDLRYLLAEGKELQTIGFIHSNPVGQRLFNHEDP
ncbi:MAG: PAS domain S-box protein, partial [Cyclobacteriaceae bacterium]